MNSRRSSTAAPAPQSRPGQTGLFYTRDSGGRHEMTPTQYVDWARRRADELGVTFTVKGADITRMIAKRESVCGDLYLDYEVSGNVLARPGLDALRTRVLSDKSVSHVFIPRRDRLARPDNPIDAMQIEVALRTAGVSLVYMDKSLAPLSRGGRQDIGELITQLVDYDQAGRFRLELAQKMVFTQLSLARAGYSTGGRPPYGFDRWLVKDDGTRIRKLEDGERVRMPGHHVVLLPAEDERLKVALRIRRMLAMMPATQVARQLNDEGVPSPDAGRTRTDNGVQHKVLGRWHATSIVNIGRNPLLAAIVRHGVRSMGDQIRFTPEGPRPLMDTDFRADGKPKVIRNPTEQHIEAQAHFDPVVQVDEHEQLQAILDARAGKQRGKPRSRDPNRNPLGCRIFDCGCGWPMYRVPYQGSFRYRCGLYLQSHGQQCEHNQIDGPRITEFALGCITQQLLTPEKLAKLKQKVAQLAAEEPADTGNSRAEYEEALREFEDVVQQLETVSENLALASGPQQFQSISKVFDRLTKRKLQLEGMLADLERTQCSQRPVEEEVRSVLALVDQLGDLARAPQGPGTARKLFELTNLKLFLKFIPEQQGKRTINRLHSGVVTFGDAPPPVQLYEGRTST
ncbi:MAG: recombinase family protein, partial [Planctomycetaceae bacterium]|nr:recombinase family protein [Planctomycetaceae bacterium]